MERRIKLLMAAIALGFLVAGGVRRGMKNGEKPLANGQAVEASQSRPTGMPVGDGGFVTPASAQLPATTPEFSDAQWPAGNAPPAAYSPRTESFAPPPAFDNSAAAIPPAESTPYNSPAPAESELPADNSPPIPSGQYLVQPNDSFWTISQRVYGTGRYFQALYAHNRRFCPQPDRLPPGLMIETPEPYLLERSYPDMFR